MAIKTLRLRSALDKANASLADLNKREAEAMAKQDEFKLREEDILKAIDEAELDTDKEAIEAEIEKLDGEEKANEEELATISEEKAKVEDEIKNIEAELNEEEQGKEEPATKEAEERKEEKKIMVRSKFFGMTMEERNAFFENENVKSFLERVREAGLQKRAITDGSLLIPTEILDILKQNITEYSKLLKHTSHIKVAGKARQVVNGLIPEAVWTEMCGKLNELALTFEGVEVDGYKVGGVICVCNQLLSDSDEALATEVIEQLGASIGIALDKAIIFGTDVKMPLGFFTRLAQTVAPEGYTGRTWVDLHTSNIKKTSATGVALFADIAKISAAAKGTYSKTGKKFWAMNSATYYALVAEAINVNAGVVMSSLNKEMPVIGGAIEILEFIPDNMIFGGYDDLYLLAERDGAFIGSSDLPKYIEDQTVFKGRAVYDGVPVIAEGFVAIGIAGTTPAATTISFAVDAAN